MTELERNIIIDIKTELNESTIKDWDRGDVYDWSEFAKRILTTIQTVIPILETLASVEKNPIKE